METPYTELLGPTSAIYHLSDGSQIVDDRPYQSVARIPARFLFPHPDEIGVWCADLGAGEITVFSEESIASVSGRNWNKHKTRGYAQCRITDIKKTLDMHRFIVPDYSYVDHRNRNKLDNRLENLRDAHRPGNMRNKDKYRKGEYTSRYKGVSLTREGRWLSQCFAKGQKISKVFDKELDAARFYNLSALELHGEFAGLNQFE